MSNHTALNTLHLSTARSWRGGENQLLLLAQGLAGRGHQALVLAPRGSPLLERCRDAKLSIRELAIRGGADLFGAWKLARLIRALRPDILHAHDGHAVIPAKLALLLAGNAGRNTRLVAHRRTVFKIKSRSKYAGRVDRVIAISQAARETLLNAGVPAKKISVVHSGMDFPEALAASAPEVQAFRQTLNLPEKSFVIAHAAALTHEKRQCDMLNALQRVNTVLEAEGVAPDQRAVLVLAGTGALEAELRAQTKSLGLEAHVRFAGFLRDTRPLWACASLALFASEAEGLCTALIDAQGAGVAAAISRAGGMVEVVEAGATGVIFGVGDTDGMSRELLELIPDQARCRDHARCRRMGENAALRARALFSARAMVDGVIEIYQALKSGVDER